MATRFSNQAVRSIFDKLIYIKLNDEKYTEPKAEIRSGRTIIL